MVPKVPCSAVLPPRTALESDKSRSSHHIPKSHKLSCLVKSRSSSFALADGAVSDRCRRLDALLKGYYFDRHILPPLNVILHIKEISEFTENEEKTFLQKMIRKLSASEDKKKKIPCILMVS